MSSDWNAESYHRVSEPQWNWGLRVLSALELAGDEVVVDAGCGTGRLTAVLLERLPSGRVIALDSSPAMLDVARRELGRFEERVAFVQADLSRLELKEVADVVFSTATFHWVKDHAALARGLFSALKPNGRLHAQCGGHGNLAGYLSRALAVARTAPFAAALEGFVYPANFSTPEAMSARLRQVGFHGVECWLTDAPTPFTTRDDFKKFTSTVVLRTMLERLPHDRREPFLEAVTDATRGEHSLDYVRLEIRAQKPSPAPTLETT